MLLRHEALKIKALKDEQCSVWPDIFKGIIIYLIVLGHWTGVFDIYIYQFHMAAFFFISGYTAGRVKQNALKTIWDSLYRLFLPYFTTFLLMILFAEVLTRFGVYNFLFTEDMPYLGFVFSIKQLLLHGNCYAWWLTAGWFIIALFAMEIIHAIISSFSGDAYGLYFIMVSIIYFIGYYLVKEKYLLQIGFVTNDLVFIGIGFWGVGFLFHQMDIFHKIFAAKYMYAVILFINLAILYYFGHSQTTTIQYLTRSFNSPVVDMIMGLNGCCLIYILSVVLVNIRSISRLLAYIGQNVLGIALFHHLFISQLFSSEELGQNWMWFIGIIGIAFSLMVWKILTTVKGIRFFWGSDRRLWSSLYDKLKMFIQNKGVVLPNNILFSIGVEFRKKIKNVYYVLGTIVVILACIPFWNQGIMNNDELRYHYWSSQGFLVAYRYFRSSWISQGRFFASLFTPIWMWLSMIGDNIWDYRILPVLSMLINIILFGFLLYRLVNNKYFAVFCSFILLVFLPITFNPMAPNAYTTTFGIPFSFLLCAMIFYLRFLDNQQDKARFLISPFMLVSFFSYEIFVTYVPLFCAFTLLKKGSKNIKALIKFCALPVLTGVFYIISYVLCQVWMPSNYAGNHIGFTLGGVIEILLYLAKVSFPGYFLFSPTYKYLNSIYHNLQFIDYVRIALLSIGLLIILQKLVLLGRDNSNKKCDWADIMIVLCSLLYTAIPALPLSISSMYQNNVGETTGFIALPVTYFTYFSATFCCCYVIWKVLSKLQKENVIIILTIVIGLVCMPVQYMNSNFSAVNNYNYARLQQINNFLTTTSIMNMNNAQIYSTDIFETRNALAVHDSYWQDEINRQGGNIQIIPYQENIVLDENSFFLSYVNDDHFVLEGNDILYMAYKQMVIKEEIVELVTGELIKVKLEYCLLDNNYYIYTINKSDYIRR